MSERLAESRRPRQRSTERHVRLVGAGAQRGLEGMRPERDVVLPIRQLLPGPDAAPGHQYQADAGEHGAPPGRPGALGGQPGDHDEQADGGHVHEPVGPGLSPDLDNPDHRDQRGDDQNQPTGRYGRLRAVHSTLTVIPASRASEPAVAAVGIDAGKG